MPNSKKTEEKEVRSTICELFFYLEYLSSVFFYRKMATLRWSLRHDLSLGVGPEENGKLLPKFLTLLSLSVHTPEVVKALSDTSSVSPATKRPFLLIEKEMLLSFVNVKFLRLQRRREGKPFNNPLVKKVHRESYFWNLSVRGRSLQESRLGNSWPSLNILLTPVPISFPRFKKNNPHRPI